MAITVTLEQSSETVPFDGLTTATITPEESTDTGRGKANMSTINDIKMKKRT